MRKKSDKASVSGKNFASLMNRLSPFENKPEIAVAVSGGADSLALTILADEWVRKKGGKLVAITVDHALRKESKAEAAQVGKWLRKRKIKHIILTHKGEKPKSSIQDEARKIRYNLMTKWCVDNNFLHLLVAHHLNDQAETHLMKLDRGSGVDGLSAMAEISIRDGVRILRPLLTIPKKSLCLFLKEQKQEWIEDPTNLNPRYKRTSVRNSLAEKSVAEIERITKNAAAMAKKRRKLEAETAKAMVDCSNISPLGFGELLLEKYNKFSGDIKYRIISSLLTTISGNEKNPRSEDVLRLIGSLEKKDFSGATLWGCQLIPLKDKKNKGKVSIVREMKNIMPDIPAISGTIWDNRFKITMDKNLSSKKLLVGALGKTGFLEVIKLHPILKNIKYAKAAIYALPALKKYSNSGIENIMAVPHIDYHAPKSLKNKVFFCFVPPKPLAGTPFGCYVYKK